MNHRWQLDEWGEVDMFALNVDIHNGPRCTRCGEGFCHHCWDPFMEECPGDKYQQMGQMALFGEDVA